MPKQRIIILIVAIALALIAVFLVKAYLDQQRQLYLNAAQKEVSKVAEDIQVNQKAVVVAKQNIAAGKVIGPEMLDLRIIPIQQLKANAANSLDKIVGMEAREGIAKGEQITMDKLAISSKKEGGFSGSGSLAQFTPVGKRAITVNVDNMAGLAGMLKPGDYVDVLATLPFPSKGPDGKQVTQVATIPLFQNILVLAVGQETIANIQDGRYKKEETKKGGEQAPLITLALTPQEASLIAFAQEQGKIRLVLRSPMDAQLQPVQPASWETLFNYIMPEAEKNIKTKAEEGPTVEIYRGLNKERVPLQ